MPEEERYELTDGVPQKSEQGFVEGLLPELESLDLLEEMTASELQHQRVHAEALDTKAGIVLGLAGAIVALWTGSNTTGPTTVRVTSVLAVGNGMLAALMALYSFWPRKLEVLEVSRIRAEVLGPRAVRSLRVTILDTRIGMVTAYSAILEGKAQRLKTGMAFLLSAVILLGVDFLLESLRT